MPEPIDLRRRQLLAGTATAIAAVSLSGLPWRVQAQEVLPLPDYVKWKSAETLIVHSANTLETRRGAIGTSVVTASDRLFIRLYEADGARRTRLQETLERIQPLLDP